MALPELIDVELTRIERRVLSRGLIEWDGPAHCTESMARAMGIVSVDDLSHAGRHMADDLDAGRPLSRRDWTRALLATEIAFASDVLGSGIEWSTTTDLDDATTLRTLRQLKPQLAAVVLRRGAWE